MREDSVDAFIRRWEKASGTERANYQLFLTELCKLLDLPQPDPAREDTRLRKLQHHVLNASLAAASVASISVGPCADDTKPAS